MKTPKMHPKNIQKTFFHMHAENDPAIYRNEAVINYLSSEP